MTEIFWPTLARQENAWQGLVNIQQDVQNLEHATWKEPADLVLSEARRLYEEEDERRKVVDSKATNYLLFVAALIPVLTFFGAVVWGEKVGPAPRLLMLGLLSCSVAYLLGFGYWVFHAIGSAAYHVTGPRDLMETLAGTSVTHNRLIRAYLINVRRNQAVNNDRISCLNIAQRFVYRMFLLFCIMFVVELGWGLLNAWQEPRSTSTPSTSARTSGTVSQAV